LNDLFAESGEALLVPRLDLGSMRAGTSSEIVRVYEIIGVRTSPSAS